jgi:hypothetical protein
VNRAIYSLALALLSSLLIALASELARKVNLEILVTDFEGRPLEATVAWDGRNFQAFGRLRLRTERGKHYLEIHAPGYKSFAGEVEVLSFSFNPPLRLSLSPLILEGEVRDELEGFPVSGAKIRGESFSLESGPDGRFRLEKPTLPLSLSISCEGYEDLKVALLAEDELAFPRTFLLKPNRVEGFISNAYTGLPLKGALVRTPDWGTISDEQGHFVLRRLVPGEEISFEAEGYFSATIPFSGSAPITIALRPKVVLVEVVEKFTQKPLPGAELSVRGIAFRTDEKGMVSLYPLTEGDLITASFPAHASAQVVFRGEEKLTLELPPLNWEVKVYDSATGEPISGAWLYIAGKRFGPSRHGKLTVEGVPPEGEMALKAPGYAILRLNPNGAKWEKASLTLTLTLRPFQVRGIYIPFVLLARPERVRELLELVDKTELNAVAVDVKSDRGFLAWKSEVPLAKKLGVIKDRESRTLEEILRFCREKGIYTIARIVVFKDNPLAFGRPDLAVKKKDGSIWLDRENLGWGNPFRKEVWDYNIALAKEVAALGFDEINLDYIRFPSDGDLGAIAWEETNTLETRTEALRGFMKAISEALAPFPVFLSADVFGLTPWVEGGGDMGIGQRIEDVSPYVDYLCPMVYPSTFAPGSLGYENPALYPYEVVYRSTVKAKERSKALVRPWLQHYSLYGVTYGLEQFRAQRKAAEEAGAWGWVWWNAGGFYEESLFAPGE